MPYTFGGGTGDDITWTSSTSWGGSGRVALVVGWWLPTTLTATRGLWSVGNVTGAEIDATTSELRFRTDHATTDGQWTTTGVGFTANQWAFLAFLHTQLNGTPTDTWRAWAGTLETAPVEVTVTNAVAPAGNVSIANAFYIGNKGTGTLAFQGDISEVGYLGINAVGSGANPFGISTAGAITNTEAEFVYQRFVLPAWAGGDWPPLSWYGPSVMDCAHISLDALPQARMYQTGLTGSVSGVTPTINGATVSQNGAPRPNVGRVIHPAPNFGM